MELYDRVRQDVVFGHGYMVAKLGRDIVIALMAKTVKILGGMSGVVYISVGKRESVLPELCIII